MTLRELTNLEVTVLLQELLPLVGARLERVYQTSKTEFSFKFKNNKEKQDVTVALPYAIMLTEKPKQETVEQSNLLILLRKNIENKILSKIEQRNFDRILVFYFGEIKVIIELFNKGNLILTDNEDKIIAIQRIDETKERSLKIGSRYTSPKLNKLNPTISSVRDVLNKDWKNEKIIVVVTRNVNFPALYMNELLRSRGIDPKTQFGALTEKEKEIIASEIHEFVKNIAEKMKVIMRPDGSYLLTDRDPAIDDKIFPSLSMLLSEVYSKSKDEEKRTTSGLAIEKVRRKLKNQEDRLTQLLKQSEEEKAKGEWIKAHVHEIEEIIKEYKRIKKEGKKEELDSFLIKYKAKVGKHGIELEID